MTFQTRAIAKAISIICQGSLESSGPLELPTTPCSDSLLKCQSFCAVESVVKSQLSFYHFFDTCYSVDRCHYKVNLRTPCVCMYNSGMLR